MMTIMRIPRGAIGDAILAAKIRDVFSAHPGSGARKVCRILRMTGVRAGRARIRKLMKQRDLTGARDPLKHRTPIAYAPRLVGRGMVPDASDRVWCGDITTIETRDGALHLAVWLDLRSRYLVGWHLSEHPDTDLTLAALNDAVRQRRAAAGLIVHSDRGVQYSAIAFQSRLADLGFVQSMSRRGNCHDNAAVEAFFAALKRELKTRALRREPMATVRSIVIAYLAARYNARRPHATLGYYSPAGFERLERAEQDRILTESRLRAERIARKRAAKRALEKARERATVLN